MNPQPDAFEGYKPLWNLERYLRECGLEYSLVELVRLRASQINGCVFCLDKHTKDARATGESEQRLYALSAWHETAFYTDRERAALAWTEALTRIADRHEGISDELYAQVNQHFDEDELANLSLAICAINTWNRLAISVRKVPGTCEPQAAHSR